MSKVTTSLTTDKGTITQHGTSGFTVTAIREGSDVYTKIEYSKVAADEMRQMVAVLLTMLDELEGESFIASCLARYAEETGKRFMSEGDGRKLVMIRGGKA